MSLTDRDTQSVYSGGQHSQVEDQTESEHRERSGGGRGGGGGGGRLDFCGVGGKRQ